MTQFHPLARTVRRTCAVGAIALGAAGLAACGGGSSSGSGSGSLTVGVTDAPVDSAEHVYVQFSSITLKPSDAEDNGGDDPAFETIEFDEPKRIDLLEQQNGNSAVLIEDEAVAAGDYDWIRLGVDLGADETVIVTSGGEFDLDIPSGAQTGLKLVTPFSVENGGTLDLTVDFDLRKSVVKTGSGDYKLRPALRLVQDDATGEIAATATDTYVSNNACGSDANKQAVYVFDGADVTPDDIDGKDPEPVTTAALTNEDGDDTWTGTAAFLEAGTYTVTLVCDSEDDNPPTGDSANDEELTFRDTRNVDVEAGETSEYDLP